MKNIDQVVRKITFHIEKKKPKSIDEKWIKKYSPRTLQSPSSLIPLHCSLSHHCAPHLPFPHSPFPVDGLSTAVKAYFVILTLMILAILIVLTAILFDLELPGFILSFLANSDEL